MTWLNCRSFFAASVAGAAALAGGAVTNRLYANAISDARRSTSTGSAVFQSSVGSIEYAVAGEGPALLALHGTGGGFDQGLTMAQRLSGMGHTIVAPSRFGYLRSDIPDDASSFAQADALVELLDELGLDRVPVIGASAGARAAVAFALRHPDRCSALVALVPATIVPNRPVPQPSRLGAAIMQYGLRSDFLFWAGTRLAEDGMIRTFLATDPALFHAAAPDEQARVRSILRGILPVSDRVDGLLNDTRIAQAPEAMDTNAVQVPTLAISLEDDGFDTLAAARHIAATVPGAKLVIYPSGGHIYIGRDEGIAGEIHAFLADL
jgi:pimeloyl-ACP methyl ester carboxylesterase